MSRGTGMALIRSRPFLKRLPMKKFLLTLAAVASMSFVTLGATSTAQAYCVGCAVGAGVLGGLAAGAIIGSAVAAPPVYYGPGPYYGYYGPAGSGCYYTRQP